MNFFIVFQNASYTEEKDGGFLWAPKQNAKGKTMHYWELMKRVKQGDIIFNSVGGRLINIITALDDCAEQEKPVGLDKNDKWRNYGWYLRGEYVKVNKPIKYVEYKGDIDKLKATKYAPFDVNGEGNQGYLYQISEEFADYLFELIGHPKINEEKIIRDIEDSLPRDLDATEKERIVKLRVGQGVFKKKLLKNGCKCKICAIENPDFLIASHIKPWRYSSNKERLDTHNGFLLCPSHDALFDKGYISFQEDGTIIISIALDDISKIFCNVNEIVKIDIEPGHEKYLSYHRGNVLKKLIDVLEGCND